MLEIVKLYGHLKVNNSVDTKQFRRDQNKEEIKIATIINYMTNLFIAKKKLTGKTLANG